jgi:hypothetical protein
MAKFSWMLRSPARKILKIKRLSSMQARKHRALLVYHDPRAAIRHILFGFPGWRVYISRDFS